MLIKRAPLIPIFLDEKNGDDGSNGWWAGFTEAMIEWGK